MESKRKKKGSARGNANGMNGSDANSSSVSASALLETAEEYLSTFEFSEAIQLLLRAHKAEPHNADVMDMLAQAYIEAQDSEKAEPVCVVLCVLW